MGATGTGLLNFGTFPGSSDALLVVTGQAAILSGSYVEAWIRPEATAEHTADEHWVETIKVVAGNIVPGTGFTIYGINTNILTEPVILAPDGYAPIYTGATAQTWTLRGPFGISLGGVKGGNGTLISGNWTVAWVWT